MTLDAHLDTLKQSAIRFLVAESMLPNGEILIADDDLYLARRTLQDVMYVLNNLIADREDA
jgi:hypothetical protein